MALNNSIRRAIERHQVWLWIESVLLICGAVLLVVFVIVQVERGLGSRAALKSFSTPVPAENYSPQAHPYRSDSGAVEVAGADGLPLRTYQESAYRRASAPLAVLRIPKIHLTVPVLDGTDARTLNHAAGRIAGTARPGESGNIGIAGHRDGFFRGLKDIEKGDVLQLETASGTDTYIVNQIRVVLPSDIYVLRPLPDPSVTLVTCYPFHFIGSAPKRFVVTAALRQHSVASPESF